MLLYCTDLGLVVVTGGRTLHLTDLTVDDLQARARDLEDQLFRMRVQQSLGQLDAPAKLRFTRRDLARIKTVITEKSKK